MIVRGSIAEARLLHNDPTSVDSRGVGGICLGASGFAYNAYTQRGSV